MILLVLALLAGTASAREISYFFPSPVKCEWRLFDPQTRKTRVVHTFDYCPSTLIWLGDRALAAHKDEIWIGDWKKGTLKGSPPPSPLPRRGKLERIGMDPDGRAVAIVSEPIPVGEKPDPVPGPAGATHILAAWKLEEHGAWKLLLREKAVFGPDGLGDRPMAERFQWAGTSLRQALQVQLPYDKARLVAKKKQVFVQGRKKSLHLMSLLDAARLDKKYLKPDGLPFYAVVPASAPLRWAVALVGEANTGISGFESITFQQPPVWLIDVERGWYLKLLDGEMRETHRMGLDSEGEFVLTTEAATGDWPRVFWSFDWSVIFEDKNARAALFFP